MDKELARIIGTAARAARKALQLTQEDAADRIGVSAEFYARIERGHALPSMPTLARIAVTLGVSADVLLGLRKPAGSEGDRSAHGSLSSPAVLSPPMESAELRRLLRRLRKANPTTLRLASMLVKEMGNAAKDGNEDDRD